ncbi:MAG: BTAD domain-containing putative transcriptional regulator [Capsulimonadales bacterium]|nr:BTAD domain-containing putative transcriptional regulator [Capsulimonadales bacterium]
MNAKRRLCLFGELRLEQDHAVVIRFGRRKAGRLLAYLALFSHRSHHREELVGHFWPEANSEVGRTNLRAALSFLRRQLAHPDNPALSPWIADRRDRVGLNPAAITTDVVDFESALRQAALPQRTDDERKDWLVVAAGLYTGPLLQGVSETWAMTERDRLNEVYLGVLKELTRKATQGGDLLTALAWARKALAADPLRQEAHIEVIRLLMAIGDRTAAQRQRDELARISNDPSEILPSPVREVVAKTDRVAVATPRSGPQIFRLPTESTIFVGRESETSALMDLLDSRGTRLVTLTGPGGTGKTRLAIETARQMTDLFHGGICFVPLAEVRQAESVPEAIVHALGMTGAAGISPHRQLVSAFGHLHEPILLILDNFEQIVDDPAMPDRLLALLADLSCLTLLVTSRHRLLLEPEREFVVPPLPVPEYPGTPERIEEFPSVQLFIARARMARPEFRLGPENLASVVGLCRRLEGIPLAIELAAARIGTLAPAAILERLQSPRTSDRGRREGTPARQETLRATFEWSWNLLTPELQRFFPRLSVFHGGWTLEAAERITAQPETLIALTELRERSLLMVSDDGPPDDRPFGAIVDALGGVEEPSLRFRMLETLREFAREKLAEDPEREALARRHFLYYRDLAEELYERLRGPDQVIWMQVADREHDNFRAALAFGLSEHGDPEGAVACAGALVRYWRIRGLYQEGMDWLKRALDRTRDSQSAARARALRALGWLAWRIHAGAEAVAASTEGLALCRRQGDRRGTAFCLSTLGMAAHHANETDRAREWLAESVALARGTADRGMLGHCLFTAGAVRVATGETAEARRLLEESIFHLDAVGDWYLKAGAARSLGNLLLSLGEAKTAVPLLEEAVTLFHYLGDTGAIGRAHLVLGFAAFDHGDIVSSHHHMEMALRYCREIGDTYGTAHALHNLGYTCMERGESDRAADHFRQGLRSFRELGYQADIALSLEGLARLEMRSRRWSRAIVLFAAAEAIRRSVGIPTPSVHRQRIEAEWSGSGDAPDEPTITRLRAYGSALSLEQACAFALGFTLEPATFSADTP